MSLPPLSWRSGRFLWSVPEILLLQYIDKVVVVLYVQSCGRQSSSHSCSLDKVVDMPVVFNDSPWFNVQKTAVVPQLLRVFLVADVPVVLVVLVPLSAAMDAQIRSSPEFMDILLCNREGHSTSAVLFMTAMHGFLAHFAPFFALLRLSRS